MNFPSGYEDCEKFNKNNPNLMLKAYQYYGATKNTTKQQIFQNLQPFYFPLLTPEEMKGKKAIYLLFLFPPEDVIIDRLNKENYDIGHVVGIYDINKFLHGYRSDNHKKLYVIVVEGPFEHNSHLTIILIRVVMLVKLINSNFPRIRCSSIPSNFSQK